VSEPTKLPAAPKPVRERWLITLEAVGNGPPTDVRIARLLKMAWRGYGLRCVELGTPKQPFQKATQPAVQAIVPTDVQRGS
jgi:hypothetical protein